MPVATRAARTPVWAEGLGDWSWPGRNRAGAELRPPSWVPAFPPSLEPAVASAGSAGAIPDGAGRTRADRARWSLRALAAALAALCATLVLVGPAQELFEGLEGRAPGHDVEAQTFAGASGASTLNGMPLPTFESVSRDAAGSAIDRAGYTSEALHGKGSFLTYLPRGYAETTRRYPVIYLLHGNDQSSGAFLEIGLQATLDRLIARREIPPLIAVMIQGGRGANNWRDLGTSRYESYVLEVQQLVDRSLPTEAVRGGRAIAGDSMGGYGAMNLALGHPGRFAVVESWLGFFDGLGHELRADRPLLSQLGLHAFLYGAASDSIADPAENAPFAAALRSAGATARSAVYPGGHDLETLHAHVRSMLVFAGRSLSR